LRSIKNLDENILLKCYIVKKILNLALKRVIYIFLWIFLRIFFSYLLKGHIAILFIYNFFLKNNYIKVIYSFKSSKKDSILSLQSILNGTFECGLIHVNKTIIYTKQSFLNFYFKYFWRFFLLAKLKKGLFVP